MMHQLAVNMEDHSDLGIIGAHLHDRRIARRTNRFPKAAIPECSNPDPPAFPPLVEELQRTFRGTREREGPIPHFLDPRCEAVVWQVAARAQRQAPNGDVAKPPSDRRDWRWGRGWPLEVADDAAIGSQALP